jgi:DNA mismatch endonuclease, patch repair protein
MSNERDRPPASSEEMRRRMSAQKRRDTAPELELRSELHRRGLRFFVDRRPLPGQRGRADILFPRDRVAVFIDGCYWHHCPIHGTLPRTNTEWWEAKFLANRERDREMDRCMAAAGWRVIRVWEHEPAGRAADRVEAARARRRSAH